MLIVALYKNWIEDIKLYLDNGMSVNSREISKYLYRGPINHRILKGDTLLIIASRQNNFALVELLLSYTSNDNKIDVDLHGDNGMTAFMWAAFNNNVEILQLLMPFAKVNARNEEGYTGIYYIIIFFLN